MSGLRLDAALVAAVAAENAAVYGYGVAGARLATPQEKAAARVAYDAHRAQVDVTTQWVNDLHLGATPPPPAPVYALPTPVTDPASARVALAAIEESTAAAYADVVAAVLPAGGELQRLAAGWLQAAAVREAQWRTMSVPFPGLVGRLTS
ncbi:MAG TPA: DUF4439 domain-containing protein [Acidothermaceae bacterium]